MKKIFFIAVMAVLPCASVFSQGITGAWNGTLDFGTFKLRIVFHIEEKNGIYSAAMDSPDQGVKDIFTDSTILINKKLRITIPKIFAVFEGKVSKKNIKGTFTQMGKSTPLILTRGEVKNNRPQDPQPPFSYHLEDVYFENKQADITLAGTFTYPETGGNFPAVVLISGSGAQNRDEEVFNHRPFAVLADYLTRNGIAVLRYDDRGVGKSKGVYHTASIQDFATDALSAVSYLKTRPEINPQMIGLIGHSEGGSIAFMLAGNHDGIAFIVSMAGSGIKGDSLMMHQRYLISKAMGVSDKKIAENEELIVKMNAVIDEHTADSAYNYPELFVGEIVPPKMKENVAVRNAYAGELEKLASPEIQSFMQYDPTEDLQKITCPVLAINGEKDLQVPADISLDNIAKQVKSNLTVKKYPDLNHLFQHAKTGLVNEYITIEETISPEVLEDICGWVKKIRN
ncbi:MAG: alpha/beta hydrolase [Lentimicrobiaceae bacterium]|nr:alpha/beta hydrolase [Lentimicrobiaceae bacterium]